jgi:thioredoxin-related protein
VIKQAALAVVLVLLISFFLSACTSDTDETLLAKPSTSEAAAAVPGEKMSDDERYAPGPMGSSSVKW